MEIADGLDDEMIVPTVQLKGVRSICAEADDGHLECELAGDSSSSCASDSDEPDDKSDKAEIDEQDDNNDSEEECEGVFEVAPDPMEEEIMASLKAVEQKLELLAEKIDPAAAAEKLEQEAAPEPVVLNATEGAPLEEAADCITRIMDEIVKLEVGDAPVYILLIAWL